jgi:effector-binding domain-containing protein
MAYQCAINEYQPRPTLVVRTRVAVQNLPQTLGSAFGAVLGCLSQVGQQPAGPPFVAYHNMDMQAMEIEAGFPIFMPMDGQDDVQAGEIPGGKYASCLHIGPYPEVKAAYDALGQYMAEQGVVPTGIAYEFYLNDPGNTPPEELQTEILFPLKTAE